MDVLVCGDSHTRIFQYCNKYQHDFRFDVCAVDGATAQGVVNPNSATDAMAIFTKKILNSRKKYAKIIIMLGEVDCGFVIWVRSKRYNINVDEQIATSVKNLFIFVSNIILKNGYRNNQIIICGSILPTIKDSTNKKILNGTRSEVDISQVVRTKKTLLYNSIVKNNCQKCGYYYMDITKDILDKTGVIKNIFLNKNPADHHLDNKTTYILWLNELKSIIN
jgi:hypothetical protein